MHLSDVSSRARWSIWIWWVLASAAGWVAAAPFVQIILFYFQIGFFPSPAFLFLLGILVAIVWAAVATLLSFRRSVLTSCGTNLAAWLPAAKFGWPIGLLAAVAPVVLFLLAWRAGDPVTVIYGDGDPGSTFPTFGGMPVLNAPVSDLPWQVGVLEAFAVLGQSF